MVLAQPAPPTQCQPVSALLSSKKILRVTLTEAAATRNHPNNNNTHTSHVVRDVVSPSSAGDSILVTPLHSTQQPTALLCCCRPVVLGWAGGEHNKDDVTTFSGDKSADWDAVILLT